LVSVRQPQCHSPADTLRTTTLGIARGIPAVDVEDEDEVEEAFETEVIFWLFLLLLLVLLLVLLF